MQETISNRTFKLDCEPGGEVLRAVFEENGKTIEVRRVTEATHSGVLRKYKKARWSVAIRRRPNEKLVDRGSIIKARTFTSWQKAAIAGIDLIEVTRGHNS